MNIKDLVYDEEALKQLFNEQIEQNRKKLLKMGRSPDTLEEAFRNVKCWVVSRKINDLIQLNLDVLKAVEENEHMMAMGFTDRKCLVMEFNPDGSFYQLSEMMDYSMNELGATTKNIVIVLFNGVAYDRKKNSESSKND